MNMAKYLRGMAGLAAIGAACAATHGPALAQAVEEDSTQVIVVEAPRSVPVNIGKSQRGSRQIIVTTVKIPARYADLDLGKPADAARLIKRIEVTAHDACKYLDRLYPFTPDTECVGRAVAAATPQARALIAAAGK